MSSINIESLITTASSRLGVTPEALKKALSEGNISAITEKLAPSDRQKIDAVMNSPELADKLKKRYMGS